KSGEVLTWDGGDKNTKTGRDDFLEPCCEHTEYAYWVFMPIRHGLLALLSQGPRYGYQLRAEFEASTAATWPLNIGQVYSTLARLERDGLTVRVGADTEGRFVHRITPDGLDELSSWFRTPMARSDR